MRFSAILACGLLAGLAACGHKSGADAAATLPPMLIDDRGITMPFEEAITKISYKPWVPAGVQVLKYAIIPPLGLANDNSDNPSTDGIAFEYDSNGAAVLLSEWPKRNFQLTFLRGQDITSTPCTIAHYSPTGLAWTTRGALAMTLQPDGTMSPKALEAEARRLIANGGCR